MRPPWGAPGAGAWLALALAVAALGGGDAVERHHRLMRRDIGAGDTADLAEEGVAGDGQEALSVGDAHEAQQPAADEPAEQPERRPAAAARTPGAASLLEQVPAGQVAPAPVTYQTMAVAAPAPAVAPTVVQAPAPSQGQTEFSMAGPAPAPVYALAPAGYPGGVAPAPPPVAMAPAPVPAPYAAVGSAVAPAPAPLVAGSTAVVVTAMASTTLYGAQGTLVPGLAYGSTTAQPGNLTAVQGPQSVMGKLSHWLFLTIGLFVAFLVLSLGCVYYCRPRGGGSDTARRGSAQGAGRGYGYKRSILASGRRRSESENGASGNNGVGYASSGERTPPGPPVSGGEGVTTGHRSSYRERRSKTPPRTTSGDELGTPPRGDPASSYAAPRASTLQPGGGQEPQPTPSAYRSRRTGGAAGSAVPPGPPPPEPEGF